MEKFHINSKGVVGKCTAQINDCQFSKNDHFDNKKQAEQAAQEKLEKRYGSITKMFKPKPRRSSRISTKNIEETITKYGIKGNINETVKTKNDVIDKWFDGDKKTFVFTERLSNNNNEFKEGTKDSIKEMIQTGVQVRMPKIHELSEHDDDVFNNSVIDLIDDTVENKTNIVKTFKD